MNIFALDNDPLKAAQYHYDVHVRKMILETVEMLQLAHGSCNTTRHLNHPCSLWVRRSVQNYLWAWQLFSSLLREFRYRFDKIHAYSLLKFDYLTPPANILQVRRTPFICAMPPENIIQGDPVESYRLYYRIDKIHLRKYTRRQEPDWLEIPPRDPTKSSSLGGDSKQFPR